MAKSLYLAGCFILGLAMASFLPWLFQFEALRMASSFAAFSILVAWAGAWMFDDAIANFLKVEHQHYYSVLMAFSLTGIFGAIVGCITYYVQQS